MVNNLIIITKPSSPLLKPHVAFLGNRSMCARDVAKGYEGVKPSTERVGGWVSTDVKLHE